jgi:hypothetical protein
MFISVVKLLLNLFACQIQIPISVRLFATIKIVIYRVLKVLLVKKEIQDI